jgi:DNA modification methylase
MKPPGVAVAETETPIGNGQQLQGLTMATTATARAHKAAPVVTLPDFKMVAVAELVAYERNARTHSPSQVKQIAASIREFGWTVPVLIDAGYKIIAGHGRVEAARLLKLPAVPCLVLEHLSDTQRRAYILADNKLAELAGWDEALLAVELRDLGGLDFDLDVVGFDADEVTDLLATLAPPAPKDGTDEADNAPALEAVAITQRGEVWILGSADRGHRIMCGDSTNAADVAKLMGEDRAQLLHADPPYGMGKEADGVQNDNLYVDELDAFQIEWWTACRPSIEANASVYIWGNSPDLWRLWYGKGLGALEPLALRNEIVWDKKSIAGMASPQLTQYPEATERCLFFQLGRHVFRINQTKDDYWQGWEPIRGWLNAEREKVGWSAKQIREICGNWMHGHWFGTSQWVFISRDNYEKLQAAAGERAFLKAYGELKAEHDALLAVFNGEVRGPRFDEFAAARPYFDNAHDTMRDVWEFPRVTGADRHGHATPKPVAMMERVMRSSLRPGEICLEPFGGSGSTLIGAEKTARRCFMLELTPGYVDVTVRRWQELTGKVATLAETGESFAEVERQRGS